MCVSVCVCVCVCVSVFFMVSENGKDFLMVFMFVCMQKCVCLSMCVCLCVFESEFVRVCV